MMTDEISHWDVVGHGLREAVLSRDGRACRYCGGKETPFHLDHVYPASKGGETSINNLVTACPKCNWKKHAHVGIWPKPIGYFDEKNRLFVKSAMVSSAGVFIGSVGLLLTVVLENGGFILVSVFGAGIALAASFIPKKESE